MTFLDIMRSTHWERPYIVSSYGERIASSFEVHRHRVCRLLLKVRHRVSRLPLLQVHQCRAEFCSNSATSAFSAASAIAEETRRSYGA